MDPKKWQFFRIGMSSALTAFYSLFLTISALVLELSHVLSEEQEREINAKDMIFGMYMYGASIMFFIYMYVVLLLDPRWYWTINMLQLSITGHHPVARFGTMHLIAANLWTWIRYVLLEEGAMEKEIREVFHAISNHTESGMDEATLDAFEHRSIESSCRSVECMLEDET
ncbi:hypothetical protein TELCIR_05114 [Teladorsagia circumcincta]|uniref:Uncharacterized protein n=1 Tax=Teladorsagia circumcincta TaxID=45464 RepID=A0A2G9US01_TELCI|nr:hypothetical protein TELCIR_05114 [Teladorsagia circumcincta]